jgi:lipoyl(octanoyl) transferase
MIRLDWTFLGRLAYRTALRLQYDHARKVAAGAGPMLFLMEHPPTITLGRHADPSNLKLGTEELGRRGIGVHRVKRGGDVTCHGPGQLMGYPVASLDSAAAAVPEWVEGHAEAIVRFLQSHKIHARWSPRTPGVWVGPKKIAALGFHISRRVSTHGFALNLDADLSLFDTIVPCGLKDRGVTSMQSLGARVPSMEKAAAQMAGLVAETFGWSLGISRPADRILDVLEDCSRNCAAG